MRPAACVTAAVLSCVLVGLAGNASSQTVTSRSGDGRAAMDGQSDVDLNAVFGSIAPTGPGCAAGLARPGQPALLAAYGMADLEHPEPLSPASVFESGSLAKQFTAAAIMLLVEDGRLRLDDDIRLYLPEMPDYGAPITIRHLLNHTSGLREQWSLLALAGNPPGTQVHGQATILDLASRQKGLNFAPGAEFLYTNTNYVLAALIIARVSDESLQQFTEKRLFRPLDMIHTRWREDFRTVIPGRATAYAPSGDGFIASMPFTNVYGNGGLLTTIEDLLRWNAFLDRPTELPGGPRLVAALEAPGRLNDGTVLNYALGLEVNHEHGRRLVAHSGSTGGYKTWLGRYPESGVSVAILCNNGGVDPVALGESLAAGALGAGDDADADADATGAANPPTAATAVVQLPADLTPYLGLFRNPVTGELLQTAFVNGRLTLTQRGTQDLIPVDSRTFKRAEGGDVRFVVTGDGPSEIILNPGASEARYTAVQPANRDPVALNSYVGTYYSAELDSRITVARQGDTLVVRQAFGIERLLTPRFADGFTTPLRGTTTLLFTRTNDGAINGVRAWANGARNIEFVRQ